MREYWLGLDIGGTKCAALLARVRGGIDIIDKLRFPSEAEKGFKHMYGKLRTAIAEILGKNGVTADNVRAIGVSCGGPLDSARGVILSPPNLPGWDNIDLKQLFEIDLGIETYIMNDANACALVEWKLGAGRGAQNMIFLTMGTGMGGGVIADGRLLVGPSDTAGEIGHIRLSETGPIGFGKAGSFEGWTSGGGIARQAREYTEQRIAEGAPPAWVRDGHAADSIDAKLLAEYARKGDTDALALFDRIGKMLGRGLAVLIDAFNPEKIVIGSVFARCEDLLRGPMEDELRREAIPQALEKVKVLPAETGERIGDLASIMAALYPLSVDPTADDDEKDPAVLRLYEQLFERYPALSSCREQVMRAYIMLRDCYKRGGKLLLMGNGGSCADCAHITGELMKGFLLKRPLSADKKAALGKALDDILPGASGLLQQGLPAIDLNSHTSLSSAIINDTDPLLTAAQQVTAFAKPGDVFIGISTSGNAKNVALAALTAKAYGAGTIALTGAAGGRLLKICDAAITVPATETAFVQEYHLPVYHALCAMVEAAFFKE